jgi:hypothetical protein
MDAAMQSDAGLRPSINIKLHARVAGVLYLVLFVLGPFVFLFGKATALVPGDPAASAANVVAMGTGFRVGMLIEVAIFLVEIVLAAILYVMFRPVQQAVSLAAAFARLGEAMVQGVNLLTSGLVLFMLGGTGALAAFPTAQREALAYVFLDANAFTILVWGIFFGFHLLLLFPRWIGVLLVLAGIGYLAQSCGTIVWPEGKEFLDGLVVAMAIPGELVFTLWLLTRGLDVRAWEERSAAARPSSQPSPRFQQARTPAAV